MEDTSQSTSDSTAGDYFPPMLNWMKNHSLAINQLGKVFGEIPNNSELISEQAMKGDLLKSKSLENLRDEVAFLAIKNAANPLLKRLYENSVTQLNLALKILKINRLSVQVVLNEMICHCLDHSTQEALESKLGELLDRTEAIFQPDQSLPDIKSFDEIIMNLEADIQKAVPASKTLSDSSLSRSSNSGLSKSRDPTSLTKSEQSPLLNCKQGQTASVLDVSIVLPDAKAPMDGSSAVQGEDSNSEHYPVQDTSAHRPNPAIIPNRPHTRKDHLKAPENSVQSHRSQEVSLGMRNDSHLLSADHKDLTMQPLPEQSSIQYENQSGTDTPPQHILPDLVAKEKQGPKLLDFTKPNEEQEQRRALFNQRAELDRIDREPAGTGAYFCDQIEAVGAQMVKRRKYHICGKQMIGYELVMLTFQRPTIKPENGVMIKVRFQPPKVEKKAEKADKADEVQPEPQTLWVENTKMIVFDASADFFVLGSCLVVIALENGFRRLYVFSMLLESWLPKGQTAQMTQQPLKFESEKGPVDLPLLKFDYLQTFVYGFYFISKENQVFHLSESGTEFQLTRLDLPNSQGQLAQANFELVIAGSQTTIFVLSTKKGSEELYLQKYESHKAIWSLELEGKLLLANGKPSSLKELKQLLNVDTNADLVNYIWPCVGPPNSTPNHIG